MFDCFYSCERTSCGTADILHMFPHFCFVFCSPVCSNTFHPSLYPCAPLSLPRLRSLLSVSIPDLADNLPMDDFNFQEQLLTPRLATAGVGGASSAAPAVQGGWMLPTTTMLMLLLLLLLCQHWLVHSSPTPPDLPAPAPPFFSSLEKKLFPPPESSSRLGHSLEWAWNRVPLLI